MKLLQTLLALPLLALPALAGELDRTRVDANAKWIAHIDVEALRRTQLFQEIRAADTEGRLEKGLAELAQTEGIRLFEDLLSVTAWGTSRDGDGAVVVLQTSANVEPALVRWQEKAGAKKVTIGERDCVEWGEGHEAGFSWTSASADGARRQIVLSKSAAGLQQAMELLDGKRPSLAQTTGSELYPAPTTGTFAYVVASGILDGLDTIGGDAAQVSVAARLTKAVRLELGESAGSLFLDLRLRTEKAQDAQKVKRIFDGLLALVGMFAGEPEVTEIVERVTQAITVEALNEIVHLRFQYGSHALFSELLRLKAIEEEQHEAAEPVPR